MARSRNEIEALLRQARRWSPDDRLALVEGLLTPEMRLRLIVDQVRRQGSVRDERRIDRVVRDAVRRVRRARTGPA